MGYIVINYNIQLLKMVRNGHKKSSFAKFVTQEQLKEKMLNLEKTMKEQNVLVVEELVMLQGKVNAFDSRVEKRFFHIEEKIKKMDDRTSSLHTKFRSSHVGEDVIDDEGITQPIIHGDAQNHFEHQSIQNQGNNNRTMFDKYGLIPLTEEQILKFKKGCSCVLFIGRLVQASFPEGYFYNHCMENVTQVQLDRLYEIISSHYNVIKRANRNAVKLSFIEAFPVIRNAAYNLRYRHKISRMMQSEDFGSCVSDNDDSNDECCDKPCVPPNHLPKCKMITGKANFPEKPISKSKFSGKANFPVCNENRRVVSKEKVRRKIKKSLNHANDINPRTRKSGKIKLSTGKFQCTTCDKYYNTKGSRNAHQLVHTDPKNWKHCVFCDYKTPYVYLLNRHIGKIHQNK